jgi:hypothetical protein
MPGERAGPDGHDEDGPVRKQAIRGSGSPVAGVVSGIVVAATGLLIREAAARERERSYARPEPPIGLRPPAPLVFVVIISSRLAMLRRGSRPRFA